MKNDLTVAVIGASGIGQHHARWHHLSGSRVAAFVGSSEASCQVTQERLTQYFGFDGKGYTCVKRMLDEVQPDIVDVSSPFEWHRAHAIMALEAGCHVVCEKPLCWDLNKPRSEILSDGKAVVSAAKTLNRHFVLSAQYPAVIPIYQAFYARVRGSWDRIETLTMEMEVKGRKGPKFREDIWIDLASHPLSLVIGFLPGGHIDWQTAHCVIGERENRAFFDYVTPQGRCVVTFVLRDIDEGIPKRRFGVNDFLVDWSGYPDAAGIYRARLTHGAESVDSDDFLHILIAEFANVICGDGGRVVVPAEDALLNLQYQIDLCHRAERP